MSETVPLLDRDDEYLNDMEMKKVHQKAKDSAKYLIRDIDKRLSVIDKDFAGSKKSVKIETHSPSRSKLGKSLTLGMLDQPGGVSDMGSELENYEINSGSDIKTEGTILTSRLDRKTKPSLIKRALLRNPKPRSDKVASSYMGRETVYHSRPESQEYDKSESFAIENLHFGDTEVERHARVDEKTGQVSFSQTVKRNGRAPKTRHLFTRVKGSSTTKVDAMNNEKALRSARAVFDRSLSAAETTIHDEFPSWEKREGLELQNRRKLRQRQIAEAKKVAKKRRRS